MRDTRIVSAPAGWVWAETTCAYVGRMIAGWATDTPTARNPWHYGNRIRLSSRGPGNWIARALASRLAAEFYGETSAAVDAALVTGHDLLVLLFCPVDVRG